MAKPAFLLSCKRDDGTGSSLHSGFRLSARPRNRWKSSKLGLRFGIRVFELRASEHRFVLGADLGKPLGCGNYGNENLPTNTRQPHEASKHFLAQENQALRPSEADASSLQCIL